MRIDVYLASSGKCRSRTEARGFIENGDVTVDGVVITKPSFDINPATAEISVDTSSKKYVSRGGIKLEYALDKFKINPTGALALDVGASSGGFTDCLLSGGARHVIAVDSGTGQLIPSIKEDARVTSIEGYNARFMRPEDFNYVPNLAVMDVSFISATLIIPAIYSVLSVGGDFVCLIKPQFEVGRSKIGKGGIVKDKFARDEALGSVIEFAKGVGFTFIDSDVSPIKGGDGNIEFLAHFRK